MTTACRQMEPGMPRRSALSLVTVILGVLTATAARADAEGDAFAEGLALYQQNQLDASRPFFETHVSEHPDDPDGLAYLADVLRREDADSLAIRYARAALALDDCHAFAHTVISDIQNPMYGRGPLSDRDASWRHLLRAVECDPATGAWVEVWAGALERGDAELEARALRTLTESGFLTRAALAYADWMLRDLPQNAILITNGDMDTYPTVALQHMTALRPDVAIANRSLLNLDWYAELLHERYGLPVLEDPSTASGRPTPTGTPSDRLIRKWLAEGTAGRLERPICPAVTVSIFAIYPGAESDFRLAGPYRLYAPGSGTPLDTETIRRSLDRIEIEDFAGHFAGPQDLSPVRVALSDRIPRNITAVALSYASEMLARGQAEDAYEMAVWAERFEQATPDDSMFGAAIAEIKAEANQER